MTPHLAFVANTAAFFISHQLPIAAAALRRGYTVELYTGIAASPAREQAAVAELSRYPITHWRVKFTGSGLNPLSERAGIWELARRLRSRRPDILHCVTPKGVLYGGIAARLAGVSAFVATVSAADYAITVRGHLAGRLVARSALDLGFRFAFGHRNKRVIVRNAEDRRTIIESGLARAEETVLVPETDTDLAAYADLAVENS